MKIKVAIVGTGFSATSHLEALRRVPNVEVFAVVSRSLEMANHFAKKYGIPHSYDDVDAVLKNEEIAVVHNCTPNYLHYAINKKALEAGNMFYRKNRWPFLQKKRKNCSRLRKNNSEFMAFVLITGFIRLFKR